MPRRAIVVFFALVAAATTIPVAAVPAPAETTRPGVQVKLLDAGTAPRGLLRLRPVTTPQSVVLTFSTEETQSGISSLHIGPLVIQTVVSLAPSSTATNGTIRMPYTYGAFRLLDSSAGSPEELMALRDALSTFQGFGGQLELSPTGAVISNSFSIPPAVNSQVRNLLQQLSGQSDQLGVPLPSQPVGIGARWQATTHLFVSGISLTQTHAPKPRRHPPHDRRPVHPDRGEPAGQSSEHPARDDREHRRLPHHGFGLDRRRPLTGRGRHRAHRGPGHPAVPGSTGPPLGDDQPAGEADGRPRARLAATPPAIGAQPARPPLPGRGPC
jgi:hypothetical protein